MGFLSGLAGGFADAVATARREETRAAERRQDRETDILKLLATADDPKIQAASLSLLGTMAAQPAGKIKNLFEVLNQEIEEPSQKFQTLMQMVSEAGQTTEVRPGLTTTPVQPAIPPTPGSAAQREIGGARGGQEIVGPQLPQVGGFEAAPPGPPPGPAPLAAAPGGQVPPVSFARGAPTTSPAVTETTPGVFLSAGEREAQAFEAEAAAVRRVFPSLSEREVAEATTGLTREAAGGLGGQQRVTITSPDGSKRNTRVFRTEEGVLTDAFSLLPISPLETVADLDRAEQGVGRALQGALQILSARTGQDFRSVRDVPPELQDDLRGLAAQLGAEQAGAATSAREAAVAGGPRFKASQEAQLRQEFDRAEEVPREVERQLANMQIGLRRFTEGDQIGGSQLVLVTFQRILDPESVVRESEYARTPAGLGFIQRIEGFVERLGIVGPGGGAGVPEDELRGMVETAAAMAENMKGFNSGIRARIQRTAEDQGLDPTLIFADTSDLAAPPLGENPAGVNPSTVTRIPQ